MADTDGAKGWALTAMRTGYAGRALTYAAIAGLSLWAIFQGGEAQGTGETLQALSDSAWGTAVVAGICVGLIAYAVWRLLDAAFDFERYGTDGKGLIARGGMVVTGLVHGVLGVAAAFVLNGGGSGGEGGGSGGGISGAVQTVLGWPGGRWIVGIAGLLTLGAGVYYAHKAWKRKYREHLMANEFTTKYDWVLRAGVFAQAVVVGVVGGFLAVAALRHDGSEAGGLGQVFEWLQQQPFGNFLVILLCLGLLAFAVFCLVNAAYRIIPALHEEDGGPTTLRAALDKAA